MAIEPCDEPMERGPNSVDWERLCLDWEFRLSSAVSLVRQDPEIVDPLEHQRRPQYRSQLAHLFLAMKAYELGRNGSVEPSQASPQVPGTDGKPAHDVWAPRHSVRDPEQLPEWMAA